MTLNSELLPEVTFIFKVQRPFLEGLGTWFSICLRQNCSEDDATVKTWMSDNAPPWIPIYLLSNTNKLRCGCLARQNKSFLNKIFKCTFSPDSTIGTSSSPLCYSFSYENLTRTGKSGKIHLNNFPKIQFSGWLRRPISGKLNPFFEISIFRSWARPISG